VNGKQGSIERDKADELASHRAVIYLVRSWVQNSSDALNLITVLTKNIETDGDVPTNIQKTHIQGPAVII
jgi:hypothetical protein